MSNTVLVIAYHVPPGGGPGVQRVLKHITYLREWGWKPVVLTVQNGDFPARDETLLAKIPSDVPVIRTPILEPYRLYRKFMGSKGAAVDVNVNKSAGDRKSFKEHIVHGIRATLFVPDARIAWWRPAVKEALKLVKQYNIKAVYSSSPPYTCALIARSVKRKTHLPWVAGFRDPWTGFLTTPERWFLPAWIDRKMERSVFEEADAIECAWKGITTDALHKMPYLDSSKFYHVPNGFDSADFPQIEYRPNSRFTITYTGSLYGHRTPRALLQALEHLCTQQLITVDEIKLVFVGRFSTEVNEMLSTTILQPSVECVDYVPHEESMGYLQRSEMSLLIVDETKESAEIVPGKVYEYLGIGRPIIAIAPKGSAIENLMQETNGGFCVEPTDSNELARHLLQSIERWRNGLVIAQPNQSAVARYERRNSAKSLATILDSLVNQS